MQVRCSAVKGSGVECGGALRRTAVQSHGPQETAAGSLPCACFRCRLHLVHFVPAGVKIISGALFGDLKTRTQNIHPVGFIQYQVGSAVELAVKCG